MAIREGGKKYQYIAHPLPWISSVFQFSSKPSPNIFSLAAISPQACHLVRPCLSCPSCLHSRLLSLQRQDSFDGRGCHNVICWIALVISPGLLRCTSGNWWQLQWLGDRSLWGGPWSRLNEREFPSPKIVLIWFWIFWCLHFPLLFGLGCPLHAWVYL